MNPVSQTAYYCCGVRVQDMARQRPLCGDSLAALFMDEAAQHVFAPFAGLRHPNLTNVARHRLIDDLLRARLADQPRTRVLLLGAGLDTRPFRLEGGDWLELDQEALLARKNAVLPPDGAPNPLRREAIDTVFDQLEDKVGEWAGTRDAVVVIEGVSMYLSQSQLTRTLTTLRRCLPAHVLICDLMSASFARVYSRALLRRIQALGGDFGELIDDPAGIVVSAGFAETGRWSVVGHAAALGAMTIPAVVLNTVLRSLRDGYRVHSFVAGERPSHLTTSNT